MSGAVLLFATAAGSAAACSPEPAAGVFARTAPFGGVIAPTAAQAEEAEAAGLLARDAARRFLGLDVPPFLIAPAGPKAGEPRGGCAFVFPWRFAPSDGPRLPAHVLPHEIGHDIFIRFLAPRTGSADYGGGAPDWLDEMAAMAFEPAEGVAMRRAEAQRHAERGALIPLERLLAMPHPEWSARGEAPAGDSAVSEPGSSETPAYYATVRALFDYLVDRTRDERVIRLLTEQVRAGAPLDRWLLARAPSGATDLSALDSELSGFVLSGQDKAAEPLATATEPPEIEFTGPDGEPLPPERQRELRERHKTDPPPAQSRRKAPPPTAAGTEIVVTGQRPRGSVLGDIPPSQTLNPHDIRAFGANDIGELVQSLGSQLSSGRGRQDNGPIVLLNGKRVSSFTEISRIPAEAIQRMEVFPEELALKYGYRADQKVVNIVTYERFSSRIGQLSYALPTEGGRDTAGLNANFLHISDGSRITLDADYNRSGSLLESERSLVQATQTPDSGRFRTLLPATERAALTGTVSGEWLSGVSSTLNGRFEASGSESLLGPGAQGALARGVDTRLAHVGTALGGLTGKWLWSFTANYDRASISTSTESDAASGARDEARSLNAFADADLVLSGSLLDLPAGPITTSLRAGGEMRDFASRSLRSGVEQRAELSRDSLGVQGSLDFPIASRARKSLAWLGDLSANANAAFDDLSDFGTLRTFGYGLTWSPLPAVNLIASATSEEGAPTVEQLGAPLVVTPAVRTFDFSRREVVDITRVFGGNRELRADDRRVFKLGLNAKPFSKIDLRLGMEYLKTRIDDPIAPFPIASSQIEAAFPERFVRNAEGRLLRIDGRPLNFRRSDQEQLRWGFNFTRPLGKVPPEMQNARVRFVGSESDLQNALPPGARIIKAEAGSAAARQFENASSRLTLSLYHTVTLADEILAREGGPVLDLLDGFATGGRGGRPRHEIEVQAAAFKSGLGARVKINWQSGTTLRGLPASSGDSSGDLNFSGGALVNINLFVNLAERLGGEQAPAWIKGTRATLGINNLFNRRPQVRDAAGSTPLTYQPAYLDPLGRVLSISLRKVF